MMESQDRDRHCHTLVHGCAHTVTRSWRRPRCPWTGGWTRTREPSTRRDVRHLALKRKDILTPATTGVDIEDAVLSDLSQPQNDNYWMSPCTGGSLEAPES